jgi:hypothetical protein
LSHQRVKSCFLFYLKKSAGNVYSEVLDFDQNNLPYLGMKKVLKELGKIWAFYNHFI